MNRCCCHVPVFFFIGHHGDGPLNEFIGTLKVAGRDLLIDLIFQIGG